MSDFPAPACCVALAAAGGTPPKRPLPSPPHQPPVFTDRATPGLRRKVAGFVGREGKNGSDMGCFWLWALRRQGDGVLSGLGESFGENDDALGPEPGLAV